MEQEIMKLTFSELFIYKKKLVNFIFLIYLYLGGFWFEDKVNKTIKFVWIVINLYGFVYCAAGTYYAFIMDLKEGASLTLFLFETQMLLGNIFAAGIFDILTYIHRYELKQLMQIIDDDWGSVALQKLNLITDNKLDHKQSEVKSYILNFIVAVMIFIIVFELARPVAACFVDQKNLRNIYYHMIATPYMENMESVKMYLFIYASQAIIAFKLTLSTMVLGLFFLLFAFAYFDQCVLLAKNILMHSLELKAKMEKIQEEENLIEGSNEMASLFNYKDHEINVDKENCFKTASDQLAVYIISYRNIRR